MSFYNYLQETLTNRELALFIWLSIALIWALSKSELRKSLLNIFKTLLKKVFFIIFGSLGLYMVLVGVILWKIDFLIMSDTKDFAIWFFAVAVPLVISASKANSNAYFTQKIVESFKYTAILEFMINFYSFSLLVELILLPILLLLIGTKTYSEMDKKNIKATNLLTNIQSYLGLILIAYTAYRTFNDYEQFFQLATLKVFALPVALTILYLPFLYCLSLFFIYEQYFIKLDFMTNKTKKVKKVKKYILREANLSMTRLNRIKKSLDKSIFYNGTHLKYYIQSIARNKMLNKE